MEPNAVKLLTELAAEYPDRPEYDGCFDTYMLGDSLLVEVFGDSVTIPPGEWFEWRTGERVVGPCRLPVKPSVEWGGALYVKGGAIIPTWPVRQYLEKGWNEDVVFEVWPSASGQAELYEDDGTSLGYRTGEYALTPLSLVKTAAGAKFTVGARKGSFKGMPRTRHMHLKVHERGVVRELDLGLVGPEGTTISF